MNEKELKEILNLHLAWLKNEKSGKRADLRNADLWGANLWGATGTNLVCPSHGAFIGWKKAVTSEDGPVIVKLLIPDDAKRSSARRKKQRGTKL